jgi:parvulin-like peptidyl-prolyl isomerase
MELMLRGLSIPLVMMCVFGSGCTDRQEDHLAPVLAVAADNVIGADNFRSTYVNYLLATGLQDTPAHRRRVLENMVSSKLVLEEARTSGIEQTRDYQDHLSLARDKLLLSAFEEAVIYSQIRVDQSDLLEFFARINTELEASHLFAKTEKEAWALYERLQAGTPFEDLAKEVFSDPVLASNGGSVGVFSFDEMDPAFEDAAFALDVGDISPPVRTVQGYSIIRLDSRFTKPLLTETEFAIQKDRLERYVLHRKRTAERTAYVRNLSVSLDPVFEEAALDRLLDQITGETSLSDDEDSRRWLSGPLATFGMEGERTVWSVATFREKAQRTDEQQRAQVRTRADLVAFITGLIARENLLEQARTLELDASESFESALEEEMEEWVYARAKERILARIAIPEDSIRAVFQRYPDEYVIPARIELWEILSDTDEEAQHVLKLLEKESFGAVAARHTKRPGSETSGGYLGYVSETDLGPLSDDIFGAEEGSIIGPLPVGGGISVFRVGRRSAARPMNFQEARPTIAEELRARASTRRLQQAANELRKRYTVSIDTELLAKLPLRRSNPVAG